MSELNKFQLWCKEILPVVQAAAEGEAIEFRSPAGTWRPKLGLEVPTLLAGIQYRIKPKTIKVNGFDVPEPMRKPPKINSTYWVVNLTYTDLCDDCKWEACVVDEMFLSRGICHITREAATAHALAMLGIDPNKD